MNLLGMIYFHLKRIVKNSALMGMQVGMPMLMALVFIFIGQSSNGQVTETSQSSDSVATVILLGAKNKDLRDALIAADFAANLWEDKAKAETALLKGEIGVVYEVPTNYLERLEAGQHPKIQLYHRDQTVKSVTFEYSLQKIVHDTLLNQRLASAGYLEVGQNLQQKLPDRVEVGNSHNIQADSPLTVMMITMMAIMYILMGGIFIGRDLVTFKQNQALKRSVLSPNHSFKIIFSFLLAYAIFIGSVNVVLITAIQMFYGFDSAFYLRTLVLIFLAVMVSLSFGLALFRMFKQPQFCMQIGMMIWMGFGVMGFSAKFIKNPLLANLSYISPLVWLSDILDTDQILPNVLILLLMSTVLFTAGSYRLEDYVQG